MKKLLIILPILALMAAACNATPKTANPTSTPAQNSITDDTSTPSNNPPTSQPPTSTGKVDISNWKTYTNTKHGFELKYPANSTVEPASQSDTNTEYIRIQNYSANEDRMVLRSGEYYLEMFISNSERPCEEELEQSRKVTINGSGGYRGLGLPGGDAGGYRYALCINRNGKGFIFQTTENSDTGSIANAILDSFKFTKPLNN